MYPPIYPDIYKGNSMADETMPDWFPLNIHLAQPVSIEHWIRAIVLRLGVMNAPQSNGWKADKYLAVVLQDTQATWETPKDFSEWLGIREVNAFEAFKLAQMHDLPENSDAKRVAALKGREAFTDESLRVKRENNIKLLDSWWDEFQYRIPVFVDLALDDDTLAEHFKLWLGIQRDAARKNGFMPGAFKRIDESTLAEWHDKRLLAACDLMNWREVSGAHYSDAAIARWLWPDSGPLSDGGYVDRGERFRKVTKPLVKRVLDWHTVTRLEHLQQTQALVAHLTALGSSGAE